MRGFYVYGYGLAFSPRVRPVARAWDSFFNCWSIRVRVTGRNAAHKYHGYTPGQEFMARAGSLYSRCNVQRGTFGRLVYSDGITSAEIDSLPTE